MPSSPERIELRAIVQDCENYLGWLPKGSNVYRARAIAAVRLERAAAARGYTPADLRLALAWCRRHRQPIPEPSYLVGYVETALEHAAMPATEDELTLAMHDAAQWEALKDDDDTEYWMGRLLRSHGRARHDVLTEWKDAGRG